MIEQFPTPSAIQARVIYRDGLMLVLDKPAGYAVHPGPGKGPNLQNWFQHLRYGLPRDPAIAHRLDRDTSGCLVLGRHAKPLRKLNDLFAQGRIEKTYWAVVYGKPPAEAGRCEESLVRKRQEDSFGYRMHITDDEDEEGQDATTDYRVLGTDGVRWWLELKPHTGRTHQLRVHCAKLGCPIIGDDKYGREGDKAPLFLHAREIAVPLYAKKDPVVVTAGPPASFLAAITACGYAATPQ